MCYIHSVSIKLKAYSLQLTANQLIMIEILKNIPFFSTLSEDDLNKIAENVKMEYFPKEHVIFNEGDPGEIMYVIKRGQVQVIRGDAVIATLEDGAFFGEMALVSDEPRNATIKTVTELEVMTITKADFKHLMENNAGIAMTVSYEVVKRANTLPS